jgi:hypothetical protein
MTPKILMCPLVTDDYDRAVRAIRSSFNQKDHNILFAVHVVVNSKDEEFIETITRFCKFNNIRFTVSQCDGTPSTGKNAVFDVFKESDCTHMSQLDGDDFFYPIFLKHIERHLKKYPGTDVLSTIPLDVIVNKHEEGVFQINNEVYSRVWGTHYVDMHSYVGLIGRDPIVDGTSIPNYGRFVLFSKKIVEIDFRYDNQMILGEDKKLHFDFLASHQNEKISYWFTMASDMWVCDRISFGIQKKYSAREDFAECDKIVTRNLQQYVNSILNPDRSGSGEIPIDYAPLYLSYKEKNQFLEDFL